MSKYPRHLIRNHMRRLQLFKALSDAQVAWLSTTFAAIDTNARRADLFQINYSAIVGRGTAS